MTLRETELLGKKLVRPLGFTRSNVNHQDYYLSYKHIYIKVEFYAQGNSWAVNVKYSLNYGTEIIFSGTSLDIDNIIPDANKLIAVFNFIRS